MSRDGVGRNSKRIIRVTPTLSTDAYAVDDVLFTATEIPRAVIEKGGCSHLIGCYLYNKNDVDNDITLVFTEGNTALGTINATADISDADLLANNICGVTKFNAGEASTLASIDDSRIYQALNTSLNGENMQPLTFLQAASDSTSVYVQGIITSGTPTYADGDIQLIFHIED